MMKLRKKIKKKVNSNLALNAYELNKMAYAQMPVPAHNSDEYNKLMGVLTQYINEHPTMKYFMLLNNELHYYTLFNLLDDSDESIYGVLQECLDNVGNLVDIEYVKETDACECWVKNFNEVSMYVFFAYAGVEECHR